MKKKIIRRLDLKIIQKYIRKCTCSLVEEDNNHFIPRKKNKIMMIDAWKDKFCCVLLLNYKKLLRVSWHNTKTRYKQNKKFGRKKQKMTICWQIHCVCARCWQKQLIFVISMNYYTQLFMGSAKLPSGGIARSALLF